MTTHAQRRKVVVTVSGGCFDAVKSGGTVYLRQSDVVRLLEDFADAIPDKALAVTDLQAVLRTAAQTIREAELL